MVQVLLIDDDPEFLTIMAIWLLEENSDIKLTMTVSGDYALRILLKKRFDVLVADYQMPGMNGLELLRSLRELKIAIPFIMLSAWDCNIIKKQAFQLGADHWLLKAEGPMVTSRKLNEIIQISLNKTKTKGVPIARLCTT